MDMPRCEQRASEVMICIFSGMGGFLLVAEPASLAINVRVLLCGVWVCEACTVVACGKRGVRRLAAGCGVFGRSGIGTVFICAASPGGGLKYLGRFLLSDHEVPVKSAAH
jgi:hypothetical protein